MGFAHICYTHREKALHVNVFSKDKAVIDEFVQRTSSGGVSANDCIIFRIGESISVISMSCWE